MEFKKLPAWHQMKIGEMGKAADVLEYIEKNAIELPEEDIQALKDGIWEAPNRAAMCPFCEKMIFWYGDDAAPRSCPYCNAQF